MSRFGNNSNNQRPQGKEDAPNKVKFSSVKLSQTKQGSPTMGLYLKREQAEKLHSLIEEILSSGEDGFKLSCIVISGESYDSGYAYVNPKEQRKENGGSNGRQGGGGGYRQKPGNFGDKSQARSFFKNKRVDDGEEEESGN